MYQEPKIRSVCSLHAVTPSTHMIAAPVMPPHLLRMTKNAAQRARRKLANSVDVIADDVRGQCGAAASQEPHVADAGLLLELLRVHPQTRPRGLSLESAQRTTPEGRQVAVERPADNLVMVSKESKPYSAAVEGLSRQDLWCLDVEARACHWLSPQVQCQCSQDSHRWVAR